MSSQLTQLLESSHRDLHQWFLFHQECLLLQETELASKALDGFSCLLQAHLSFENTFFLSQQNLQAELRWPINVYQKEHNKLLDMLEPLKQRFSSYTGLSGRKQRIALLELLDHELTFYRVIEHHEEREEEDLFHFIAQLANYGEALTQWQATEAEFHAAFDETKALLKACLSE